jgi:hypothetical protein
MQVSPAKRQTIITLSRTPDGWHGRINGFRAEIRVVHTPVHINSVGQWRGVDHTPRWRVCVRRIWHEGAAATTWDAIEDIEAAIRHAPTGQVSETPAPILKD